MASLPTEEEYGYEDHRFQKAIDENFLCSICYNVLKEPRMCQNNEHIFCRSCITEHLNVNSHTCPECKENLTVETLRRAPRLVTNYLSELKINCDYSDRGCHEFTRLEELDSHVENCGFAPVKCSNEECGIVVNKRELIHHESAVCEFRKVKCHNCVKIEQDVKDMKENMEKESKKIINAIKEDVKEVKDIVAQMFNKLTLLEQNAQMASSSISSAAREDIIVIGGSVGGSAYGGISCVEKFSWKNNVWEKIASINTGRANATSFVFGDELCVVGGHIDGAGMEVLDLNTEAAEWKRFPNSEFNPDNDVPVYNKGHCTLVYGNCVIEMGGSYVDTWFTDYDVSEEYIFIDEISEVLLTPPYTRKQLGRMPQPIMLFAAELFGDRILIFGGRQCLYKAESAVDSILEFDLIKDECKVVSRLPHPISAMASVRWEDKVVLVGGQDKEGNFLNQVLTYHSTTGKIDVLPSMLEARASPCAVSTGNMIVVMGGEDAKWHPLASVECFVLEDKSWEYLPSMNEARSGATAELVPAKFNRN